MVTTVMLGSSMTGRIEGDDKLREKSSVPSTVLSSVRVQRMVNLVLALLNTYGLWLAQL